MSATTLPAAAHVRSHHTVRCAFRSPGLASIDPLGAVIMIVSTVVSVAWVKPSWSIPTIIGGVCVFYAACTLLVWLLNRVPAKRSQS